MLRIVPFLPLGYGRLTSTLYLCPVFGEYYSSRKTFSRDKCKILCSIIDKIKIMSRWHSIYGFSGTAFCASQVIFSTSSHSTYCNYKRLNFIEKAYFLLNKHPEAFL